MTGRSVSSELLNSSNVPAVLLGQGLCVGSPPKGRTRSWAQSFQGGVGDLAWPDGTVMANDCVARAMLRHVLDAHRCSLASDLPVCTCSGVVCMHSFHMIHDLVFHPFCTLPGQGLALCRLRHRDGGRQDMEIVRVCRAKTTWSLVVLINRAVPSLVTAARYYPRRLIDYSRFGNWLRNVREIYVNRFDLPSRHTSVPRLQ